MLYSNGSYSFTKNEKLEYKVMRTSMVIINNNMCTFIVIMTVVICTMSTLWSDRENSKVNLIMHGEHLCGSWLQQSLR